MPTELTAPITQVTVYTNQARVTRSGNIDLPAGTTELVLSGLPQVIEADSVRVSGYGAGITIRGVDVKADVLQIAADERKTQLTEELDTLKQQKQSIQNELKIIEQQLEYYTYVMNYAGANYGKSIIQSNIPFERVTRASENIQAQLEHFYAQQQATQLRLDDVNEQIETIEVQLRANPLRDFQAGQAIHIAIEAKAPIEFTAVVEYLVRKAYWMPIYDVRLLDDNEVEVSYMARIAQETGENWDDVQITLSTAKVFTRSTLPDLEVWYVEQYSYRSTIRAVDKMAMSREKEYGSPRKAAKPSPPPEPQPVAEIQKASQRVATSGALVSYDIATPISITGDGEPHKTTVTISGMRAELDYVTAPRSTPDVFLRATVTNTSDYILLPGEASIFHENDFVGKVQLPTIAPTEEFEVQLGIDDRIKIERELIRRKTDSDFFRQRTSVHFAYEIRIQNLVGKVVKLDVQDQYPLEKNTGVTVKVDKFDPPPTTESELRILSWKLQLNPAEKRTIHMAFIVEYGRNQGISGLDD